MLAAFVTCLFLGVILMSLLAALHMAEESGGKILAALKGISGDGATLRSAPVAARIRYRTVTQRRVRVQPKLRAAA